MRRVGIFSYAVLTDNEWLTSRDSVRTPADEFALREKYLADQNLKNASSASVQASICAKATLEAAPINLEYDQVGVVYGTALGSMSKIEDFFSKSLKDGPQSVSPMEFPSTVANASGSLIGIWFGLRGPSITLSNGSTSSIDAVGVAFEEIKYNQYPAFIAGSVEDSPEYNDDAYSKYQLYRNRDESERVQTGAGTLLLSELNPETIPYCVAEVLDYEHVMLGEQKGTQQRMFTLIEQLLRRHIVEFGEVKCVWSHRPYQAYQYNLEQLLREKLGSEMIYPSLNPATGKYENYFGASGIINIAIVNNQDRVNGPIKPYTLFLDISSRGCLSTMLIKNTNDKGEYQL